MKIDTKQITAIAIPVSLEYVVILVLNFVNQIIVGGLGALPIAAVGFANSLTFILMVTISALGTSVGILTARAYGGNRLHELNQVVTIAITFAAALTLVASSVLAFFPAQVLQLAGASVGVANTGVDYLRLSSLALTGSVISAVLSGVFRSVDQPRLPMYATLWTLTLNAILSYALVYGVVLPEMGVAGAGLATFITSTLKALILGFQLFVTKNLTNFEFPEELKYWLEVIRPLFVLAIPLGITELVWTVGQFSYGVIVQQLSDEALASFNIANGMEGIFIVGSLGLAVAATVLVGRAVGSGDLPQALAWVGRIKRIGIMTGLGFGLFYAVSVLVVPVVFKNAGNEVQNLAIALILSNSVLQVIKVRNMILAGGILTSGSDVKGVIYGDLLSVTIGLPLAVLLGLFTPLGIWGVMVARAVDELVKLAVFEFRASRLDWEKLVAEHNPETPALH